MMQRLKQRENPVSPIEAEALLLLQSAEPYQIAPAIKHRVRMKLLAAPMTRQRPSLGRKLGVSIMVAAAAASAAWGARAYLEQPRSREMQVCAPQVTTAQVAPVESHHEWVEPRMAAHVPAPAATFPSQSPAEAATLAHVPPRPHGSAGKSLVYDAMRALRRENEPAHAARLLDEYLARFPSGAMGEEALALAIEAHQALRDGQAPAYANRYLEKYPDGRFTARALRFRAPAPQ